MKDNKRLLPKTTKYNKNTFSSVPHLQYNGPFYRFISLTKKPCCYLPFFLDNTSEDIIDRKIKCKGFIL